MRPDELDAFRRGDRALFRRLVDEHSPRLLAVAMSYTRSIDESHDAVQEVWIRAFEKRHQLHSVGGLVGWLLTTCRNVCQSEARRASTRLRHAADARPSGAPPPDEPSERAALRADVFAAIGALPERQRDTVVLRILEDRSTRETAELLGCAEGTVKAALHQALKKLNPLLRSWNDAFVS